MKIGKILLVLVVCALMTAPVFANITNGGFETGNLNGWSTTIPTDGFAGAVTSHSDLTSFGTGTTSWGPTEGQYFALLKPDGPGNYTQMWQTFTVGDNTPLSFDYFWDSQDFKSFNDTATGWLIGPTGTVTLDPV